MIKLEVTIIETGDGLVVSSVPKDETGTEREAAFAAAVNESIGALYGLVVKKVVRMDGKLPDDIAKKFADTVNNGRHFRSNPGN
jgi:hypothetical protein